MLPDIKHDEPDYIEDENQGRSPYLAEERVPLIPDDEDYGDEDSDDLDFNEDDEDEDDYYGDDYEPYYDDSDDEEDDPLDYDDTDHGDEVPF